MQNNVLKTDGPISVQRNMNLETREGRAQKTRKGQGMQGMEEGNKERKNAKDF